MEEFTPETLKRYISQHREKRNVEEILENMDRKKKRQTHHSHPRQPQNLAELDAQIRNNLVEIIRKLMHSGEKKELIHLLQEHKKFIENILEILQK